MFYFRYVPESVRWLRTQNKVNAAENILKEIGQRNGKFSNASLSAPPEGAVKNTSYKYLFTHLSIAMCTLVQCYTW